MTFYHGTSDVAAKQIELVGLLPRVNPFDIAMGRGFPPLRQLPGENQAFVYLTKDRHVATLFALLRAQYDKATKGESIGYGILKGTVKKLSDFREPNAKPALVLIALDEMMQSKLRMDPQFFAAGLVYPGAIPASKIQRIEVLANGR